MATQVMYFTNTDFVTSRPLFLNYSQSLKSKKVDSLPAITSNVRLENSGASVDLPSISESSPTNQAFQKQAHTQRLFHYLQNSVQAQEVARQVAANAWKVWKKLESIFESKLPAPDAGIGPDGQILYTWNQNSHHFEIEIFPEGIIEFFYLNFRTDETWEYDDQAENSISEAVIEKIRVTLLHE
ncbi:MAG: hypothetical protein DYG89_44100 [Caldilinea sp. CFX5]|nr:hypothetical protein [Caldilinea sp. CFX5]